MALDLIERNQSKGFFAGPKTDELVRKAEAALGYKFPPTYREFVSKLGCGTIAGEEFYGLTTDNFVSASVPNGVWLTLDEREKSGLPSNLIVIYALGEGTYFGLDSSNRDETGECPVVAWQGPVQQGEGLEFIAADFGEFLLRTISDALD